MCPQLILHVQATLNQGRIEGIFVDSMRDMGLIVNRPVCPISLELSKVEAELKDPNTHPIKVTLKRDGQAATEIVHAKFVVGADGTYPTK